jgi:DNA topoisomerase III
MESKSAKVVSVIKKPKVKLRPVPLNTVEATKLISRKLKISPEKAMEIMEKLYNRGFLSYPRTETTVYSKMINLRKIISSFEKCQEFGPFAKRVASGEMWSGPRNGKQDDKSHPPIHPVKSVKKEELLTDEWRIFELLTRHFLATVSKDAKGNETLIKVDVGGEEFNCQGVIVEELNWLEIFKYEKW